MSHLFERAGACFVIACTAFVILAVGSLIAAHGAGSQSEVSLGRVPSFLGDSVRVGLRYGPGALGSVTIGASEGTLVLRSVDFPDGLLLSSQSVTLRAVAADSRTERVYKLNVGEYTDQLGAEQRLAELSMRLGHTVDRAIGMSGARYIAYFGSSPSESDMRELRADLGLRDDEAEIKAFDLPAGMMLEIAPSDGSPPVMTSSGYVVISPDRTDAFLYLDSPQASYRGSIEAFVTYDSLIELVNIVDLEDYLRSAVGSEMSSYAPIEALKAQAVLMRTYVVNHMIASKHDRFDVCDNHHCQAYRGVSAESSRIDPAVEATKGEILVDHTGAPVQVYYHACCGGITESSANAWATAFAHLVSVLCSEGHPVRLSTESAIAAFIESADSSHYCSGSSNYRWERQLSAADLLDAIQGAGASVECSDADDLGATLSVVRRTDSGRVSAIEIVAGGQRAVISGDLAVRMALGKGDLLPSSFFVVKPVESAGAGQAPPLYCLVGAGYGHGVGVCQTGAIGMANSGYDYRSILSHYFSHMGTADH